MEAFRHPGACSKRFDNGLAQVDVTRGSGGTDVLIDHQDREARSVVHWIDDRPDVDGRDQSDHDRRDEQRQDPHLGTRRTVLAPMEPFLGPLSTVAGEFTSSSLTSTSFFGTHFVA